MRFKNMMLSLVLILGLLLGNAAFYGNATPAAAHIPDDLPVARPAQQVQNQVLATFPVIDDFEALDWGEWYWDADWGNTFMTTTVVTEPHLVIPGQITNTIFSLEFASGGWGGSTGHNLPAPQDWSSYDGLSFWLYGSNSGIDMKLTITDNGGEGFEAVFTDNVSGWKLVSLPWQSFTRASWQPGGAPDDGLTLTGVTAYGFFMIPGTSAHLYFDQVKLFETPNSIIDDFEALNWGEWYWDADWGNTFMTTTVVTEPHLVIPGQITNTIFSLEFASGGWGGSTGHNLPAPQDWSGYAGLSFWLYGSNSGIDMKLTITDNGGEGFEAVFTDDVSGWKLVSLPWQSFTRASWQPGGAPDDGLTLTGVTAYGFFMIPGTSAHLYFDQVAVFTHQATFYVDQIANPPGQSLLVGFSQQEYSVVEGDTITVTVTLNMTAASPVTVTYATADGTAVAGVDYISTTGALVFPPDTLAQSFTVETIDNTIEDGARTVLLTLSDPMDVELGAISQATLTIQDNELPDACGLMADIVDDFESGLPSGTDAYGNDIGFVTWGDFWTGTTVEITTTLVADSDPLARPGQSGDTHLLQFDANVNGWGGLTHAFENEDVDTWVPQDWTAYEGISFWLYGQNTGNDLLFEIQDNRNPGSTGADVEIWSYGFKDDFSGWQLFTLDFSVFVRKEIGNGAPNDGFGRDEVHGWAFGTLNTGGADVTYYLDNVALIIRTDMIDDFESGLPSGTDAYGNGIGFVTWGDFWTGTTVEITTTLVADDAPLARPCQTGDTHLLQFDANVNGWGGLTHAFENEDVDTWVTQDWSTYEGISFWLYGQNTGNDLLFEVQDNRNPGSTGADTEIWSYGFKDDFSGWQLFTLDFSVFVRKEIGNGAPNDGFGRDEVHGWAFGTLNTGGADVTYYLDNVMIYGNTGSDQPLTVAFAVGQVSVTEGQTATLTVALSREYTGTVTVEYATAEANARLRQYTPVSGTLTFPAGTLTQTISIPTDYDGKHTRDVRVAVNLYEGNAPLGFQRRAILTIVDIDPADPTLIDDFEGYHPFIYQEGAVELSITTLMAGDALAVPGQLTYEDVLTVDVDGAASFSRVFAQGQDWSAYDGLSLWFYGQNSGETITLQLRENMTATTAQVAPEDWVLVWSDEFNDAAGTPPNSNVWKYELGDGALNGIVGWGNSEFQYYTDSTDNSFTDGAGNLVIRLQDTDPDTDLVCWYGPCEYTSARLLTQDRLDFEYGRIEARVLVPDGPGGLWPAFWMLGTDIPDVGWPQSGEIDIMEYVSRLPNEIFGTIHGPGYEGGASFGNTYTFTEPVASEYHTYAVEWMPDHIIWYVDGIQYHEAVPADVAPNEWVFNHPFFMLLNAAIGGNFGGAIADGMTFPQDTLVDYVRVYQAEDTAERFEATFVDNFTGWREVFVPFSRFTRSAEQPADAPDDGLTLTEVWGYGFALPENSSGTFHLDQVRLATREILTLTVNVDPVGSGTVTQDPASGPFYYGDTITLIAEANPGWAFVTWSGDLGSDMTTVFTLTENMIITATFSQIEYSLEVLVDPVGAGAVMQDPASGPFYYGDTITLTAEANPGWSFSTWSGDLIGAGETRVFTITENMVVTATFAQTCIPVSGVDFDWTPQHPMVGELVQFTAAVMTGTSPLTYTWDFGDGTALYTTTDNSAAQTFPLLATTQSYTVTLRVINGCTLEGVVVERSLTVTPRRIYLPLVAREFVSVGR